MREQDGTRTTGRLEVVVEWRGTVLDVRHLGPGDTFTVGDAKGADLALEHPALPVGQAVVLARVDGGEARVFAPPGGRGRLRLGEATEDFAGVAKLGVGARARVEPPRRPRGAAPRARTRPSGAPAWRWRRGCTWPSWRWPRRRRSPRPA